MEVSLESGINRITISLPLDIFPKEIILKCLYWYLADYEIDSLESIEDQIRIVLKSKHDAVLEEDGIQSFKNKLHRDLVDSSLRQMITEETKNIRDLLIAKAFQHFEE